MHEAVKSGNEEIISILIQNGAVQTKDRNDNYPETYANPQSRIMQMLAQLPKDDTQLKVLDKFKDNSFVNSQ